LPFFEDFFAVFLEDLPPFFVAIKAHHLSCRTGPPGRAYLAKNAGSLRQTCWRGWWGGEGEETDADDLRHVLEMCSSFWRSSF